MKKKSSARYVVCIRSEGAEDLEVRKIYRVLPDESSAGHGHLRVIDESGEDYVYPADWFVTVEVPEESERALAAASTPRTPRTR